MALECAVCGTSRVTRTLEAEDGVYAVCEDCYPVVVQKARMIEVGDAAELRHRFRTSS